MAEPTANTSTNTGKGPNVNAQGGSSQSFAGAPPSQRKNSSLTRSQTFKVFQILNDGWREIEAENMDINQILAFVNTRLPKGDDSFTVGEHSLRSTISDMGNKVPKRLANSAFTKNSNRITRLEKQIAELENLNVKDKLLELTQLFEAQDKILTALSKLVSSLEANIATLKLTAAPAPAAPALRGGIAPRR